MIIASFAGSLGDPSSVASAREVEALARTITSEAGAESQDVRVRIGWAVRNRARHDAGGSIHRLQAPGGVYGPQGGRRPFSSAEKAVGRDLRLAAFILALPWEDDPTGGADSFVEPTLQNVMARLGTAYRAGGGSCEDVVPRGRHAGSRSHFRSRCYGKSYEAVREEWLSQGQRPISAAGKFELWTTRRGVLFAQRMALPSRTG
jgi:hypothetical protein